MPAAALPCCIHREGDLAAMTSEAPLFSRRRVLRWGLGGVGLLVAGGGGLLALRGRAPEIGGLRVLSDAEFRTFEAVAGAVVPVGGPFPEGAAQMELGRAFDEYLADEPPAAVADIKRALLLVDYGPLLFEGRLTTFSRLDEAARVDHWTGWSDSRLLIRRQISGALRRFVSLVFYDRPEMWARINYPGPLLARR